MVTINSRAAKYADKFHTISYTAKGGYLEGAKEQKKIDKTCALSAACTWCKSFNVTCPGEDKCRLYISIDRSIELENTYLK